MTISPIGLHGHGDDESSSFPKGGGIIDIVSADYRKQYEKQKKPKESFFERKLVCYHDGGHFVGYEKKKGKAQLKASPREKDELDRAFAELYKIALREDLKPAEAKDFIKTNLESAFSTIPDGYIETNIDRERKNYFARRKRFLRKAYFHRWNYFVTITYDSAKFATEDDFRAKLRKCLSNLHTRRGWRYMGVFEYSPKKRRLHFHALMNIPDGQMPGKIILKEDYSTKRGKKQKRRENSFFAKRFGVTDFASIGETEARRGGSVKYLTKYLEKSSERIVYSRDIPSEVEMTVHVCDIAAKYYDHDRERYVLFDDHLVLFNYDDIEPLDAWKKHPYETYLRE